VPTHHSQDGAEGGLEGLAERAPALLDADLAGAQRFSGL
jgi:hypothetical protein